MSENGRKVFIRHLVLDGSSQWIIGENVTQHSNIMHIGQNALQFVTDGVSDTFTMIDNNFLSYLPMSVFSSENNEAPVLSCLNGNISKKPSRNQVKAIVDKVHKQVCGHTNLTDMRLILQCNGLWNDIVCDYASQLIESCVSCRATASPQPSRKVSISSLSREFN